MPVRFSYQPTAEFRPERLRLRGTMVIGEEKEEKAEIKPYAVHATYAEGMLKRHRLREAQLWLSDDADYYTPGGLLMLDLAQLDVPADWEQLPSRNRVQFHMKNMAMQLDQDTQDFILTDESVVQFWYAAGVAVALSRVLILPRFMCYCDELWHLSLEVSPQWLCRYPGAVRQTLPFHCSADSVLNYPRLDDLPSQHGAPVHYRESTLMDSPKLPQSFKADVVRVHVSPKHAKEHAADKLDRLGDVAATSFEHQLAAPVLPWKVSEEKVCGATSFDADVISIDRVCEHETPKLGSPQRLPQHHGTGSAEASSKATETFDLRGKVERCLHLANSKSKLQQASLANHTSQTKAEYKVASRAAHKSALAAYHHHFTQLLTKVQRSMHEGNTHPTYRSSGNLASPNVSLAGSCGMASLAGSFVQLLSALLNGFNTLRAFKRLKNNKAAGVCNIVLEMLKYGDDSVHSALYRVILGI
ncbi:MAG: glycosyltransferase family 77 [Trebouxia sp. A1-2]|nr:MAG: glycosyltransferase family 77 [Trebouxia sp. A1-2]